MRRTRRKSQSKNGDERLRVDLVVYVYYVLIRLEMHYPRWLITVHHHLVALPQMLGRLEIAVSLTTTRGFLAKRIITRAETGPEPTKACEAEWDR